MSLHRSLVARSVLKRHRNVLTRAERVKQLEEEGKLDQGDSIFGLPKVRIHRVKAGGRHKEPPKAAQKDVDEKDEKEQKED